MDELAALKEENLHLSLAGDCDDYSTTDEVRSAETPSWESTVCRNLWLGVSAPITCDARCTRQLFFPSPELSCYGLLCVV